MIYYVICKSYMASVLAAKDFANHYSISGMNTKKREPTVKAGDHTFIFLNENSPRDIKGRKGGQFITIDDFVKKYYSDSTPNSQTV